MSRLLMIAALCGTALLMPVRPLHAQNSEVYTALQAIRSQQSRGDGFYPKGAIHCQRQYEMRNKLREDNNVFFTAITAYTLNGIRARLTAPELALADSIIKDARASFEAYRNGITYNFWLAQPQAYFPNDPILSKHGRFKVPDDLDVTAMVYLAAGEEGPEVQPLKEKMDAYANGQRMNIRSTPRVYQKYGAYTTWFGRRMKPEFDICVQANALLLVQTFGLPWTAADTATAQLIVKMMQRRDPVKKPYIISPSYQRSPVVLYHLARLLAQPGLPMLQEIQPQLIAELKTALRRANNSMDRLLLLSSLQRLGQPVTSVLSAKEAKAGMPDFVFFKANLLAVSPIGLRQLAGKRPYFNYDYYCEGYCQALLAEYLCQQRLAQFVP